MFLEEMAEWFYGENGQQSGPVSEPEFAALVAGQKIHGGTLVWREGMPAWVPFSQALASGMYPSQPGEMPLPLMMPPATSGLAVASLVLGILGVVSCFLLFGIPAVICGHMALSRIRVSPVAVSGRGMAITGLVCGYISLLIGIVPLIMIFGIFSAPHFFPHTP